MNSPTNQIKHQCPKCKRVVYWNPEEIKYRTTCRQCIADGKEKWDRITEFVFEFGFWILIFLVAMVLLLLNALAS